MSLFVHLPLTSTDIVDEQHHAKCNSLNVISSSFGPTSRLTHSFYFNGQDSFISISAPELNSLLDHTQDFSIVFWVNKQDLDRAVLFGDFALSGLQFNIETINTQTFRYYCNGSPDLKTDIELPIGIWTHVAFTWSASTSILKIYLQGIEAGSYHLNPRLASGTGSTFYLGRDNRVGSTVFSGYMCDFRIYNHTLTASQVYNIYESGDYELYPINPSEEVELSGNISQNSSGVINREKISTQVEINVAHIDGDSDIHINHPTSIDSDLKVSNLRFTAEPTIVKSIALSDGSSSGDHAALKHLDYEHSGHTGFAAAADLAKKQDKIITGSTLKWTENNILDTKFTLTDVVIDY